MCVFCDIASGVIKAKTVYESDKALAFLDMDPINEGHVLVIPKDHYLDIDEMPEEVLNDVMAVTKKITKTVKQLYNPDGYSIMQNGGAFNDTGHFHVHIFPRYQNDGFGWTYPEGPFEYSDEVAQKIMKNVQ